MSPSLHFSAGINPLHLENQCYLRTGHFVPGIVWPFCTFLFVRSFICYGHCMPILYCLTGTWTQISHKPWEHYNHCQTEWCRAAKSLAELNSYSNLLGFLPVHAALNKLHEKASSVTGKGNTYQMSRLVGTFAWIPFIVTLIKPSSSVLYVGLIVQCASSI